MRRMVGNAFIIVLVIIFITYPQMIYNFTNNQNILTPFSN